MKHKLDPPLVQLISKPLVPPWDDSAKNIAIAQVHHREKYQYRIFTDGSVSMAEPGLLEEAIYRTKGAYSPKLAQNLRVLAHGLRPRGAAIYHYFYAPNPMTSYAGRIQKTLARVRTVHTICSAPQSFAGIGSLLFADRVIALSRSTFESLLHAGVPNEQVRYIPPGIEPLGPLSEDQKRAQRHRFNLPTDGPLIIFPGDYEFSSAAQTVAAAAPLILREFPDATLVYGCRAKREASRLIEASLKEEIRQAGLSERVRFIPPIPDMYDFIGAADLALMPAESLYAKMDVPLVLLEAMSRRVPMIVADVPPLNELLATGAAVGIAPQNPELLAKTVSELLKQKERRLSMGEKGEQSVVDRFSSKAMAHAVEDIYDEVRELS